MDELDNTINIFSKYANQYQEKYMDHGPYVETYDYLTTLVSEGSAVLDVACGPAIISKYLGERIGKLTFYGCDLSPDMIRLAQENLPSGRFELRDSRDIQSIEEKFDVLISGFCLPYLTDGEAATFIADARGLLNSGGLIYLSTMEGDYKESGYPENSTGDRIFTYYHSAEFLLEKLTKNSFEVLHILQKPFLENELTKATDIFIYARAV